MDFTDEPTKQLKMTWATFERMNLHWISQRRLFMQQFADDDEQFQVQERALQNMNHKSECRTPASGLTLNMVA